MQEVKQDGAFVSPVLCTLLPHGGLGALLALCVQPPMCAPFPAMLYLSKIK